ncbi:hypothetical protein AVEN_218755-1 [Araneus ventricosus]|uniref:Uncharacterized protein n=1 Tax=Araneus ventricosus TaxID=182803 RepID=A0A4Y2B4Y7_ARAVE|nr:hypothetical protein AVEN_218755-1 [Araneus ventricosus]
MLICAPPFCLRHWRVSISPPPSVRPCAELNKLWCENGYEEKTNHGQGAGFLGLNLYPIEDKIKLNLRYVRNSLESGIANGTIKRHVMRIISQIFDTCGLISPFVITVKILMQELWQKGLKWDEQLPRTSEVSLYVLYDASPKAYGVVAYFRYIAEEGRVKVSFIYSKVAPLKTLTRKSCRLYYKRRIYEEIPDEFPLVDGTSLVVSAGTVMACAMFAKSP